VSRLTVTTFMADAQGHRARQVDGFDAASVLVRGERSEEIANAIVERFSQQGAPRRPLGSGGCVRIDSNGSVWLLNKIATGWASSGIVYDSWRELLNDWDLALGEPKTDKTGLHWPVLVRGAS
jgi:hypothetical protein